MINARVFSVRSHRRQRQFPRVVVRKAHCSAGKSENARKTSQPWAAPAVLEYLAHRCDVKSKARRRLALRVVSIPTWVIMQAVSMAKDTPSEIYRTREVFTP